MATAHDRRTFLKRCVILGTAAATAGLFRSEAAAGWFGTSAPKDEWLSLGKLTDFPDNRTTRVATAVRTDGGKAVKTPKLTVLRKGDRAYVMSTKCTHFGCEVEPDANGVFVCPCHAAEFDRSGAVTKGPAKRALPWHEVRITPAGALEVNVGKTVPAPPAA